MLKKVKILNKQQFTFTYLNIYTILEIFSFLPVELRYGKKNIYH